MSVFALNPDMSTQEHSPLTHSNRPQTNRTGGVCVDTTAIVFNHDSELVLGMGPQDYTDAPSPAVPSNVGEGLLDDPIEVQGGLRRQSLRPARGDLDLGPDPALFFKPAEQRLYGVNKAAIQRFFTAQIV